MSHDEDEDEDTKPKPQGRKGRAKQAAEEAWRAFEGSLPPLDVGQFHGKREPREGATAQLLAACERVIAGVGLKDASILAGLAPSTLREWQKAYLARVNGREETARHGDTDTWAAAAGYTVTRAQALCRARWQGLAEAGGKGSSIAQWMLERRGGDEYRAPVQRVKTETKTTNTTVNLSLEASLTETAARLGLDDRALAQMGEWLARAQTQAARGQALPAPPLVLEAEPVELVEPEEPEELVELVEPESEGE
jgi:hypothetical protein